MRVQRLWLAASDGRLRFVDGFQCAKWHSLCRHYRRVGSFFVMVRIRLFRCLFTRSLIVFTKWKGKDAIHHIYL